MIATILAKTVRHAIEERIYSMNIKTVTIVGANGTVGSNIAGIFASFGKATVYMVSRSNEKSRLAALNAIKSVKADSISSRLIPVDYGMLADCVRQSDLIFESVAENFDIKQSIIQEIAKSCREDSIIASGTSGLSITSLAEILPTSLRSRFGGIHMFNPPYHLSLCEVIPTKYSDRELFNEIKEYLKATLFRTVVEVKDSPAFLGNRVGFYFINMALQYAEKYQANGGIDYIDEILGCHTGRSMAPIVTADYVGLDVHKAIVNNVHEKVKDAFCDVFALPNYVEELISLGHLGKKSKGGLYKQAILDDGQNRMLVYDIASKSYRERINYDFPFVAKMKEAIRIGDYQSALTKLIDDRSNEAKICLQFLLQYVVFALYTATDIGYSVSAADDVMATGFNWCPPQALVGAFSNICDVNKLCAESLDPSFSAAVDVKGIMNSVEPSTYDYRPFLKSK